MILTEWDSNMHDLLELSLVQPLNSDEPSYYNNKTSSSNNHDSTTGFYVCQIKWSG